MSVRLAVVMVVPVLVLAGAAPEARPRGHIDVDGVYALHLYDGGCLVDAGKLAVKSDPGGQISGSWSLGPLQGDSLRGTYDKKTRQVVLHFGFPDHGYSLWGVAERGPEVGDASSAVVIAGHWSHSGIAGPDAAGAFHAKLAPASDQSPQQAVEDCGPRPQASRRATRSAMANADVSPGDSMPSRLTRPGTPCCSGPSMTKSVVGPPAGASFGRMPV